jgi:DNA modification methylase
MDVNNQIIEENYALYLGDCNQVMLKFGDKSIHLCGYSPPFAGIYNYSSSSEDLSNCKDIEEFLNHYEYTVKEISRLLKPGCFTVVHCQDVYIGKKRIDLPHEIISLHGKYDLEWVDRKAIWKEPLTVAIRTRSQELMHKTLSKNSSKVRGVILDYLVVFQKKGEREEPIPHDYGMMHYAGEREVPIELHRWRGHQIQKENRYSHWIWRRYADGIWDDIRLDHVLKYKTARDSDDEKHIHPLQLDVIDRFIHLYTNPGDVFLSPFAGVGSEVYGAISNGRKGIGIELKESYFNQSVKNLKGVKDTSQKLEAQTEMNF